MLSPNEFTVGTLADAEPLSLMLPRSRHEKAFLIGQLENGGPAAVFLDGEYTFHFFETTDAKNWKGILIPKVHVEVDEASVFDPEDLSPHSGTVVRVSTHLVVLAKAERSFGRHSRIMLETDLPPTHDFRAGFSRWQIVIGDGRQRRILRQIDTGQGTTPPS